MNVEIGTKASQFLFWKYINGIFITVLSVLVVITVLELHNGDKIISYEQQASRSPSLFIIIFKRVLGGYGLMQIQKYLGKQ
jgi:hypothetical protein